VHLCEVKEVGVLEKYGVEESCGRWVNHPHYSRYHATNRKSRSVTVSDQSGMVSNDEKTGLKKDRRVRTGEGFTVPSV
jgi:hypothetical protein